MKKLIFSILVLFILSCGFSDALAKDKGNAGKGPKPGPNQTREQNQQRKQRQKRAHKADGKTEGEVKAQSSKNKKARHPDKARPQKKSKAEDKTKAEAKAGEKGHQQQLQAFKDKRIRETNKHNERAARLNRLAELAEKQGDAKTLERINKLKAKEQMRYNKKQHRIYNKIKAVQLQKSAGSRTGKPPKPKVKKAEDDD